MVSAVQAEHVAYGGGMYGANTGMVATAISRLCSRRYAARMYLIRTRQLH
jgi:hypothetical protein